MKKVELRSAFAWTCDECGIDNYHDGIVYEFDPETEREMKDEHGVEIWEEGEFITIPDEVECKFCGEVFETYDYRADDE